MAIYAFNDFLYRNTYMYFQINFPKFSLVYTNLEIIVNSRYSPVYVTLN